MSQREDERSIMQSNGPDLARRRASAATVAAPNVSVAAPPEFQTRFHVTWRIPTLTKSADPVMMPRPLRCVRPQLPGAVLSALVRRGAANRKGTPLRSSEGPLRAQPGRPRSKPGEQGQRSPSMGRAARS